MFTTAELMDRALRGKLAQRRKLAELPFERKIELVLQLQRDSKTLRNSKPTQR